MTRQPLYPREEDYPGLTLDELEREIGRLTVRRAAIPGNARSQKSYESRLFQLNKHKQRRMQERE
jgi:hypothetical protein